MYSTTEQQKCYLIRIIIFDVMTESTFKVTFFLAERKMTWQLHKIVFISLLVTGQVSFRAYMVGELY